MKKDPIEHVIEAIDVGHPNGTFDSDKVGESKTTYRKKSCVYCGYHRLKVCIDDENNKHHECEKCGKTFKRASYRRSEGPNISETHTKKLRDIGDKYIPELGVIKKLKKSVTQREIEWIEWAHSAKYSGDNLAAKRVFNNLRWAVYVDVAEQVAVNRQESASELAMRLLRLVEMVVEGRKCGQKLPTVRTMANELKVEFSNFSGSRRWGAIVKMVECVLDDWERNVIREVETYLQELEEQRRMSRDRLRQHVGEFMQDSMPIKPT